MAGHSVTRIAQELGLSDNTEQWWNAEEWPPFETFPSAADNQCSTDVHGASLPKRSPEFPATMLSMLIVGLSVRLGD
ncbi:hypothetical protein [Paraburkholderia hospita]|nr:hypothetical protein [Paraburkholderia hospita]